MHPIISKTFGGLSPSVYWRHFIFGASLSIVFFLIISNSKHEPSFGLLLFILVNTFLYPYARFVYESIVGFVMGNNIYIGNAIIVLISKLFTIAMCWAWSLFIAPFGLAYLFWHHSRS